MVALLAATIVALFTSVGEIDVAVDGAHAPRTAANFLAYVRHGAFDGGSFFRTVLTAPDNQPHNRAKIDVIQAGNRPGFNPGPPVALEPTSETGFFICIGAQPSLDDGGRRSADQRGFAAFGQVVRGMDVVRAIHDAPHAGQQLTPPIVIRRALIRERT